jgi:MFS family permease
MVWALSAWTLSILIREEGMSAAQAGSILGLVALTTGPAGNFLGGWILDRMDARNASAAPAVIMSASLAVSVPFVLIFSVPHDLVTSIVGYTLLQLVLACANSPGWVGVQHLTPPQHRGVATALFVATYTSISLGVGPVIVGLMSDFVFHGENALSRSLMVTLLVLAAGGAAAGVLARAPYARAMAHESPQTGVTADLQSGCKAH